MAGAEKVGAHKTSMLQDFEAGRPMELEAIVGAVVELGERLGVRDAGDADGVRVREDASTEEELTVAPDADRSPRARPGTDGRIRRAVSEIAVPPSGARGRLDRRDRLRRRRGARAAAPGGRPHDGRPQGRLRQQGDDGACSSSTRSSGRNMTTTPCMTRGSGDAALPVARMYLAEDRTGDRLQAEAACSRRRGSIAAGQCSTPSMWLCDRVRDHRLRLPGLEVSAGRFRRVLRAARRAGGRRARTPSTRGDDSGAGRRVAAVQAAADEERRAGGRRIGEELAAQPGALPGGARRGNRASG